MAISVICAWIAVLCVVLTALKYVVKKNKKTESSFPKNTYSHRNPADWRWSYPRTAGGQPPRSLPRGVILRSGAVLAESRNDLLSFDDCAWFELLF